jgi:hypothetical protein
VPTGTQRPRSSAGRWNFPDRPRPACPRGCCLTGSVSAPGYVHPAEAADEILDDALQPFLDDLQRRAGLGTGSAAVELAAGVLLGLYNCRHGNTETLLEYSPDYAGERAAGSDCAKLGIELPAVELLDLMPEWTALLR